MTKPQFLGASWDQLSLFGEHPIDGVELVFKLGYLQGQGLVHAGVTATGMPGRQMLGLHVSPDVRGTELLGLVNFMLVPAHDEILGHLISPFH